MSNGSDIVRLLMDHAHSDGADGRLNPSDETTKAEAEVRAALRPAPGKKSNGKLSDRLRPNSEAAPWVVDAIKELESERDALRAALTGLMTNPHMDLGDLVYNVREREQNGWEGPSVTAWSNAVTAAKAALAARGKDE